jgi:hypothetical protein
MSWPHRSFFFHAPALSFNQEEGSVFIRRVSPGTIITISWSGGKKQIEAGKSTEAKTNG